MYVEEQSKKWTLDNDKVPLRKEIIVGEKNFFYQPLVATDKFILLPLRIKVL